MKYLLDTNVLIALRDAVNPKPPRDAQRAARMERIRERCQRVPAADLAMSMISLGELRVWVERHRERSRAEQVPQHLQRQVRCVGPAGDDAGGEKIAGHYGRARAGLEQRGETIGGNDLWLAAHALALELTLVTNNTREFQRVPGLATEDWTQ